MLPTRARLNESYFGESPDAVRFQALWLVFDILIIAFFVASPFIRHGPYYLALDYIVAALLACSPSAPLGPIR